LQRAKIKKVKLVETRLNTRRSHMSMKALVRTDCQGNITIHMEGGINFDNGLPLRKQLEDISSENPTSMITLDLLKLDFVGSSGIGHFVETVKYLETRKGQFRLQNIQPEFLKVFKLFNFHPLEEILEEFEKDDLGTERDVNNRVIKGKFEN
jgi:anti-sigma B factor antagonist